MALPSKNQINTALCYSSSGYALNRNIASTGFNIESALMQNDAVEELAEIYLLNSHIDNKNIESIYKINKYLNYPLTEVTALSSNVVRSDSQKVKLEKNDSLNMSLGEAIRRRKSYRKYTGDAVPANYVSTILRAGSGVTHAIKDNFFVRSQRACASGGGLYPVKLYVFANRVKKLPKAIYAYDPIKDALFLIEKNQVNLDNFLLSQSISELPNIKDCAFILFFTIEAWKSVSKYGSAGLRFAYIEVGEIAQNVHLAGTSLGIASCAYASFSMAAVNAILRVDGDYESFQHAILFGIGSEE